MYMYTLVRRQESSQNVLTNFKDAGYIKGDVSTSGSVKQTRGEILMIYMIS